MDPRFKRSLKADAHHLKPVVFLGAKGLTSAVIEETNVALTAHELIKVKISGLEKEERLSITTALSQEVGAEFIQMIGNIAILYRKNLDK